MLPFKKKKRCLLVSFKKEVLRRYAEESGVTSVTDGGARANQGGGGCGVAGVGGAAWPGGLGLPSRCERLRPSQGFCSPALPFIKSVRHRNHLFPQAKWLDWSIPGHSGV